MLTILLSLSCRLSPQFSAWYSRWPLKLPLLPLLCQERLKLATPRHLLLPLSPLGATGVDSSARDVYSWEASHFIYYFGSN